MATRPIDVIAAEMERRVARLRRVLDLSRLAGQGATSAGIASYYERSRLGYRYVHSHQGAMHMALNPGGTFDRAGYEGQASLVEERFPAGTRDVLELACGNGYNLALLARRHPGVGFHGIDLVAAQIARAAKACDLPNARVQVGDFQALPFADDSQDCVFVIESLCHATNLPLALSEIGRVLRPGGAAIVMDAWRTQAFADAPGPVREAAANAELAMAVSAGQTFEDWVRAAGEQGLTIAEDVDLTAQIRPNLERLARLADRFLSRARLARAASLVVPQPLLLNAVAAYLLPLTIDAGIHTYRLIALEHGP